MISLFTGVGGLDLALSRPQTQTSFELFCEVGQ